MRAFDLPGRRGAKGFGLESVVQLLDRRLLELLTPWVLPIFTFHRLPADSLSLSSTDFYRFLPIFRTFLGDFNHQKLPFGRLYGLWE